MNDTSHVLLHIVGDVAYHDIILTPNLAAILLLLLRDEKLALD
jgi:hypothetical protein